MFCWWDRRRVICRESWSTKCDNLRIHKLVIFQFNNSCSPTISICAWDRRLRQRIFASAKAATGMSEEGQGPQSVQDRLVRTVCKPNGQVAWDPIPYVKQSRLCLANTGRWLVSITFCHLRHVSNDDYRRDIHWARHSDQRIAKSSKRRLR